MSASRSSAQSALDHLTMDEGIAHCTRGPGIWDFDMLMLNDMDRFHLVIDVIDRVPRLVSRASGLRWQMVDEPLLHRAYTREVGDAQPGVRDWVWPDTPRGAPA